MIKKIALIIFLFSPALLFCSKWSDKAFDLVEEGSASEIRRAIETDYSFIKYTNGSKKQNLLLFALEKNRDYEVIRSLLRAGISPKSKDKNGKTALMYACENSSDADVVKAVLEFGAPFNFQRKSRILKKDKHGNNAFDYAKMNACSDKIIPILNLYAIDPKFSAKDALQNENIEDEMIEASEDAVSEASDEIQEPPVETEELPAPVDAEIPEDEQTDEEEQTEKDSEEDLTEEQQTEEDKAEEVAENIPELENDPLIDDEEVELRDMLNLDKMVGPGSHKESIYLYDYAQNGASPDKIPSELVKTPVEDFIFIENANEKNSKGHTLLMEAAKAGEKKAIRNLILSGADVNARDNEGWTALMFAVRFQKDPEVTKMLLGSGASPVIKNNYGINALKLAAGYSKSAEVVEAVIKPYKPDSEELRSAFVYGIKNSNSAAVLKPFIEKKLQLNVKYNGKTYLMYACESNKDTDVINMLLKAGASKMASDEHTGKTAFDYARENARLKHDSVYWSLNTK